MITNQDRAAVRRIFDKVRHDIAPLVEAKAKKLDVPVNSVDVMAAQNTIRICMEVVLNACIPYDRYFCGELAVRLAAYAISATPIEDHAEMVRLVQKALPGGLANKLKEGAIIKTSWVTDGIEHPNVPDKGSIQ
jgi:hypothetical protein